MELKSNFLLSIRRFRANRTNSIINLTGLVLGIGVVAVVLVFLLNELGYNSSFANNDRIYRVLQGQNPQWANTPFILGETVSGKFSEVEAYAHQYQIGNLLVQQGQEWLGEPEVLCTESTFFNLFGIKILEGNVTDFDKTTNQVLLSRKLSVKYFGNQNPIGKPLVLRNNGTDYPMEVAAVYEDIPQNSTFKASLMLNSNFGLMHLANNMISTGEKPDVEKLRTSWEGGIFFTNYLLLKKGVSPQVFEEKLKEFGKHYSSYEGPLLLSLQPLTIVYFGSQTITDNNHTDRGNLSILYILAFIGLLILVVAIINYLNLATAENLDQSRSFAVRKVCGAPRGSIISQMIMESSFISLLAIPFALLFVSFLLPRLSTYLGKSYALSLFNSQTLMFLAIILFITLLVGILAGLMVSLKINRLNLIETLKGKNHEVRKFPLRKVLIIFQVMVFIVLISVMISVQKQVHYAFTKDLGFAKEGLIRVPLGDHNYELFKQEIKKNPDILDVSSALWIPPHKGKMAITVPKVDEPEKQVSVLGLFVDYHFIKTMGMNLLQGQDFDELKNTSGVIINESAVKALGLKTIIGEQTAFGPVVGVVTDFNMYSLRETIQPMIIGINPSMCREVAIRINTRDMKETIGFLEKTWKATGGLTAFDFSFTDDILNKIYTSDIQFSKIIGWLAIIAIFIASMGLIGLSILLGRQKTKEIGIRKVNGAKVIEILVLLNKDFVWWVIIAFAVATPIAWFLMHRWLQGFAYQTGLSWWIFALSGLMALGIALLTVSWQSWRAATRNPVEALRYE